MSQNTNAAGSAGKAEGQLSRNRLVAMETPLASIFGSGFLVIVSVLNDSVGRYSIAAMAAVCGFAYVVGAVVRFNIKHAEPILKAAKTPSRLRALSTIAHLTLIPAYVISIALYIRILSSYALGFVNLANEINAKLLTTAIILVLLAISLTSGLRALDAAKKWSLFATAAIIVLLIGAFGYYDARTLAHGALVLPRYPASSWWRTARVLAGTLIVVQGFETTRYLGGQFDSQTRISAARLSQILSTVVYVAFVACATPLMHFLSSDVKDNSLMTIAGIAATWLTLPLALVAVFSQFSAAVADVVGGSGSLVEVTRKALGLKATYVVICVFAIMLCWATTTFTILALASRAFAFYYFMQCTVAFTLATKLTDRVWIGLTAVALAFVTLFAIPVS